MTPIQEFGLTVEDEVIWRLQQEGLDPEIPLSRLNERVDLWIDGTPIHVKAARRKTVKRRKNVWCSRWQFNFRNVDRSKDGFIVAVCARRGRKVYFIIPTWLARKDLRITRPPEQYTGWAAQYRERWDLIKTAKLDNSTV